MYEFPFVSVIIPVRNEAKYIADSLGAVLSQDYPSHSMEVLVADGLSTDRTREIIAELADEYAHIDLKVLENPDRIVPTGMNIALMKARGDIIVRVDGHTMIAPDYLRACVQVLQESGADNVGGKMRAIGESLFGQSVSLATSSPFGVGGARFHYSDLEEWLDTVYMGAWKRESFENVGLFDEELVRNQDDEFNYRLRSQGGNILLSPKIKSQYFCRSSPKSLWKQYFQYGYWKVRVLQKHPFQMRPRQFVPAIFVGTLFLSFILIFISPISKYLFLFVIVSYLLFILLASILLDSDQPEEFDVSKYQYGNYHKLKWSRKLLLFIVFPIMHLGYGMGFLIGLVKFADRWKDKVGKTPFIEKTNAQEQSATKSR